MIFAFDLNIRGASTIPSRLYVDPVYVELEREPIFAHAWQLVGPLDPPADVATDPEWSNLVAFSDEIQDEDVEICETVQRNLRSRVCGRGRYSAKREVGVHHFHSLLHEFLT